MAGKGLDRLVLCVVLIAGLGINDARKDPETGRIRVLYVGDMIRTSPYPLMLAEPSLDARFAWPVGPDLTQMSLPLAMKFYRQYTPRTYSILAENDVILVDNPDASIFEPKYLIWFRDAVQGDGAGFFMVGGNAAFGGHPGTNWGDTPVQDVLPVWCVDFGWAQIGRVLITDYDHEFVASLPFDRRWEWMENGEIRRYGYRVIVIHWLFIILLIPVIITSLFLLRDWFFHEFHIMGDLIVPTFYMAEEIHKLLGMLIFLLGLIHILAHIFQKTKPMLPVDSKKDFKATIHTILYIFHLTRKEERGSAGKYRGNQRIAYIATVYTFILVAITVLFVQLGLFGETGVVFHITAGILVGLLAGYRILYLLRTHDSVAVRCILGTGTMPEWYVKKNHLLWYREIKGGYTSPPELDFDSIFRSGGRSGSRSGSGSARVHNEKR